MIRRQQVWLPGFASLLFALSVFSVDEALSDETRLLRQPTISDEHVAFAYGGDLWIVDRNGGDARRLTSTPAVESNPHFSPDGKRIAFTSNRSGTAAVYVLPIQGGTPRRLTWYPAGATAKGWSPDGKQILYTSSRETAPTGYGRLWTVSAEGGPSKLVPAPLGHSGSFSPSGRRLVVDPNARWDSEWRHYRGGQNTSLVILNLDNLEEIRLPNERTTDIQPVWLGEMIYFLSDRDWSMNIWSYEPGSGELKQLTDFSDVDIKSLAGHGDRLVFERNGYLHTYDTDDGEISRLRITATGDFPWAEARWEDVSGNARSGAISPTGKRAVFEARGEVFTVPAKKGSTRNLTQSSDTADRSPIWSPQGDQLGWFSDSGDGYSFVLADQTGLKDGRKISIGESKMAWEAIWSPDGSRVAFVDDDVRVRVIDIEAGEIVTADTGGANIERGSMGITWSPDSKWLAYAKTFENNLRRITVWSVEDGNVHFLTDPMADAVSPAWSRDGKHLYLLASTDVALGAGWANTSAMGSDPQYGVYAILLTADAESPFAPESDEEESESDETDEAEGSEKTEAEAAAKEESRSEAAADDDGEKKDGGKADEDSDEAGSGETADDPKDDADADSSQADEGDAADKKEEDSKAEKSGKKDDRPVVKIDLEGIERRIITIPMPVGDYRMTLGGPKGSVFVGEVGSSGMTLHKFSFEDRKSTEFLTGIRSATISADGKKMLYRGGSGWSICDTAGPAAAPGKGRLGMSMRFRLNRPAEWEQMFEEAWRYMRDFFYDPDMHGRDWEVVRERYAPLVPFVRHRADLNYLLDQMNGELSVGHSFVFGGDMPSSDNGASVGVLGADMTADSGRWKISRIYTFESWNPRLRAPLDRPGLKVKQGNYLVGVNGDELTDRDDPYQWLDGTAGQQTVLHVNDKPSMEDAWQVTVEPARSESMLRQRAWVEDNRRRVDELSDGKLAYVWVPNTGQPGVVSFNRYYFAQQHMLGAVIDERFNGGGLLDDYMVDLMTRRLRAAITNEVPGGRPFRLPAGILGPKALLINEFAGSGGDFFPWVFRQQEAGPLIGTRTWGGLVKSSVHYPLIDGGALTAPDNAVFDPINKQWIGENKGIAPDIEVRWDAKSIAEGRDVQLERGVEEVLKLLESDQLPAIEVPEYSTPASRPDKR